MARIPYSKLKNLRSGNTVWRVWGWMKKDGSLNLSATQTQIIGKKVLHIFSDHHQSTYMRWKRFEKYHEGWMYQSARFLNDLHGLSCFDSKRSADRFVKEVKEGFHPDVVEDMRLQRDLQELRDSISEFFDEDYREPLFSE